MGPSLKCQFCTLDFSSAYKMIPHVYFGHRKKISRQVRDRAAIELKCPAAGCAFSHSLPVEDSRPEIVFSTLAEMFLAVEDHIVTIHTSETKLVECPYCSKDLTNCVYWVHLEEHMHSPTSTTTPTTNKSSPAPPKTPEDQKPPIQPSESLSVSPDEQKKSQPEDEKLPCESPESVALNSHQPKTEKTENIPVTPKDGRLTRSGSKRSQILRDLEEIEKKIALKKKEEEENMKLRLEGEGEDPKPESAVNMMSGAEAQEDQIQTREEENTSTTTSEIQLEVEKQIEENILQSDSLNYPSKGQSSEMLLEDLDNTDAKLTSNKVPVKKKVPVREDPDEHYEAKKVSRSREQSGEGEAGSRRRSISGEKRKCRSSVWNKEQQSASVVKMPGITTVVEPKLKPILTEEMERNIIYGNFKMKDPIHREDKLLSVKREIENRFKEEEEKRKRMVEEKRKAEEKEREKLRVAEERIRKERERLKEEKRRSKQRRKENKEEIEMETEEGNIVEDVNFDVEAEDDRIRPRSPPVAPPERPRAQSPNQYQKIKLEISKMFKENEVEAKVNKAEKRQLEDDKDSPSPEHVMSKIRKTSSLTETNVGVVSYQIEEEEEDDELEMMMREFQERQSKQPMPLDKSLQSDSLSLIQSSYNADLKDDRKLSTASDVESPVAASPVISLSLSCSLCREEGEGAAPSYRSAYQLLAHVFLSHRKKIVSNSRKSREMSLACPENCGFVTPASSDGVSIDYFNSQLGVQLFSLSEHMRLQHTGEDLLVTCPQSGLTLDLSQAWAWQHLANHMDSRRVYCRACNMFPFKTEEHRCSDGSGQAGLSEKANEMLRQDVEILMKNCNYEVTLILCLDLI